MNLPTKNADLLEVRGAGTTTDWDNPDTQGAVKFKGRVDAVYTERRERNQGAGDNLSLRRTLIVSPRKPRIQFEARDEVIYRYRGQLRTAIVQAEEEYDAPGLPVLGSLRLTLEPV